MSERNFLDELARSARTVQPPHVDVTSQVMATIRRRQSHHVPSVDHSLRVPALVALTITLLMLVPGFRAWQVLSDPLVTLFSSARTIL